MLKLSAMPEGGAGGAGLPLEQLFDEIRRSGDELRRDCEEKYASRT